MKKCRILLAALVFGLSGAWAGLTIPGADDFDGALNITEDTVIDLGEATAEGVAGKGMYDADKWAVIFRYSSVTIAEGATLSFKNNDTRAPVVWLVSGDVTINGTLSLNGQSYRAAPNLAEPGPGGFRGGTALFTTGIGASAGFGVGGGGTTVTNDGYGGSYGSVGTSGPATYGNPALIPLIGGSGGGGAVQSNYGGGGGGGAILIATPGTVTIDGELRSNGGAGRDYYGENSGGGSGGGIRLLCDTLAGSGTIRAIGGSGIAGGSGRIRVERVVNNNTISVVPEPSVLVLGADDTGLIWPPEEAPKVKIVSIGGKAIGADPKAAFGTQGADAILTEVTTTTVVIETENVENNSVVKVRYTPRANANYQEVDATVSVENGDIITWTAEIPVRSGYAAVQVKVVRP